MVALGIERLAGLPEILKGKRVGLIANATSVNHAIKSSVDILLDNPNIRLTCLFGPQQGFWGETQDNMIEWKSGKYPLYDLTLHSLYGEHRKPTAEMLKNIDVLVFDVQDVGCRIYTYIWTMAHSMQASAELGKEMVVCDRPNPIGGQKVEGNVLSPAFSSFAGLYPLPTRHGMTVGEIAQYMNKEFKIGCKLTVVPMEDWKRSMWYDETSLPWVTPSANIPTLDSAVVFPGTVVFEGTNVSEGRGTTRPFEFVGAPFVDGFALNRELSKYELRGITFRPCVFIPTFQKHKGLNCGGVQLHVTNRNDFESFKTGMAILKTIHDMYPKQFEWKQPPYEYIFDKLPVDVISGCSWIRESVEAGQPLEHILDRANRELETFLPIRKKYLFYS